MVGLGQPQLHASFSRCTNIKGDTKILGSSYSTGPRLPFLRWEILWWALGLPNPRRVNFKVASFSRCRNITGGPQNFRSSPSSRPHPLFPKGVILWWVLTNPCCVPNLKSLAPAVAEIIQGHPPTFSFGCDFMMGLGKPKLCTKFEFASFGRRINIKRQPPNFGAPLTQGYATFSSNGIWRWDLANSSCEIWSRWLHLLYIRDFVFKRQMRFLSHPFGELEVTYGVHTAPVHKGPS